jgi:hypothetical protein
MEDDRPYIDSSAKLWEILGKSITFQDIEDKSALSVLYQSMSIQIIFVIIAGLLFVFLPFARRGPAQLAGLKGVGWGLLYVCGLGYGYLAVETVLIHELVLFVGHPTYAVTIVILSMLLFSGLGSIYAGTMKANHLTRNLRIVLGIVLALATIQAFVSPPLLHAFCLGWPLWIRIGLIFVLLAPLGFVMGMPFPIAMRALSDDAGGMVPWAWALNGWMSVVASVATVLLSRSWGYSFSFGGALLAYGLALALAGFIQKIGKATPPSTAT